MYWDGFTPPTLCRWPHANHVHLKVQITGMGPVVLVGGGGGEKKTPCGGVGKVKIKKITDPCSIFFKVTK